MVWGDLIEVNFFFLLYLLEILRISALLVDQWLYMSGFSKEWIGIL